MGQVASADVVDLAVFILLRLTVVPILNRSVVTGDTAVDLGLGTANRAGILLAG